MNNLDYTALYCANVDSRYGTDTKSTEYNIAQLREFLCDHSKVVVAFSGGVDSSYLLYMATKYCQDVKACFVQTPFQPQFELCDAQQVAKQLGVKLDVIPLDVMDNKCVVNNAHDRCYHCKLTIMTKLINIAKQGGYSCVIEGTNASDDIADRAGFKALQQLGVLSPLRMCGITKSIIRQQAHLYNLATADKHSYACLATRIPCGIIITRETLNKVEQCEQHLKQQFGLTVFRVRTDGQHAYLQSCHSQIQYVQDNWQAIQSAILQYFDSAELVSELHKED